MNEALAKSNKDRRSLEERLQETMASLNTEEDKANHLNKVKARLDASLAEVQEEVAKEKAARADSEKHRRKLEGDLKVGGDSSFIPTCRYVRHCMMVEGSCSLQCPSFTTQVFAWKLEEHSVA